MVYFAHILPPTSNSSDPCHISTNPTPCPFLLSQKRKIISKNKKQKLKQTKKINKRKHNKVKQSKQKLCHRTKFMLASFSWVWDLPV